jgi:predicted DNA-binding transcriptional regulator AlpA
LNYRKALKRTNNKVSEMLMQENAPMTRPLWSPPPEAVKEDPYDRINHALATGVPAQLTTQEVLLVTSFSQHQLRKHIKNGTFPQAVNNQQKCYHFWASAEVKRWLEHNGFPTVFGKKENAA